MDALRDSSIQFINMLHEQGAAFIADVYGRLTGRAGVCLALGVHFRNDSEYGLIKWHQERRFGRSGHISFNNPDFVKYAEAFGAKGYRVNSAAELLPTLEQAFNDNTVVVIDVPVDCSENMKLTEKQGGFYHAGQVRVSGFGLHP